MNLEKLFSQQNTAVVLLLFNDKVDSAHPVRERAMRQAIALCNLCYSFFQGYFAACMTVLLPKLQKHDICVRVNSCIKISSKTSYFNLVLSLANIKNKLSIIRPVLRKSLSCGFFILNVYLTHINHSRARKTEIH